MSTDTSLTLLLIPPEVILHIFSYLDLPDLASLSLLSPFLARLASDPALHKNRIRIIAPSRVKHSLFGLSPKGLALRPTVGDLVHRGVMRGLGIERRWRMGIYFYSHHSVVQYESGLMLQRRQTGSFLSSHLRRRSLPPFALLKSLHQSHVLPDVESSSLAVSRSLLPVMRKLKWSFQKDKLAKMVRNETGGIAGMTGDASGIVGFGKWLESRGKGVVQDCERVRLAICPDIRKTVGFYEDLGR